MEWPDLIAPGWSGWSTFDAKEPYWGRVGQSAGYLETGEGFRNFRLESNYIGLMPFLLALFGVASVCRRGGCAHRGMVLFWEVLRCLRLAWRWEIFMALRRLLSDPIFNNIRAPIKFLDNMQIALGILAGFGVDALYSSASSPRFRRGAWISCAGVAVCILLGLWGVSLFEEGWRMQIAEAGFAAQVEALLERMRGLGGMLLSAVVWVL